MKSTEVMALLKKGKPVVVGEFRRVKAEVIKWRDKQTQRAMSAPSIRFTVETEEETFEVSKFQETPEGVSDQDFVDKYLAEAVKNPPFKKGQSVVVEIQQWTQQKGMIQCRGDVHPFEAAA